MFSEHYISATPTSNLIFISATLYFFTPFCS